VKSSLVGVSCAKDCEAMRCKKLLQLLQADQWKSGNHEDMSGSLAAHIRSCMLCQHHVTQLCDALVTPQALTCEQCRDYFPAYYEATRPEYPLVELSDIEMLEVTTHLWSCPSCREEYEELVRLAELEEQDGVMS
jgi:NMD protein affecting ribosome stability and mRNA decay